MYFRDQICFNKLRVSQHLISSAHFSGVVGNTFVIIVFGSSKSLRRSLVNIFLLNQSAIDLGASLMAIITAPNKANAAGISDDLAGMTCMIKVITIPSIQRTYFIFSPEIPQDSYPSYVCDPRQTKMQENVFEYETQRCKAIA